MMTEEESNAACIKELEELSEMRGKQREVERLRNNLPVNINALKDMSELLKIIPQDNRDALHAIYIAMLPIAEEIVGALETAGWR